MNGNLLTVFLYFQMLKLFFFVYIGQKIVIIIRMFMVLSSWPSYCESLWFIWWKQTWWQVAANLQTTSNELGCEFPVGCCCYVRPPWLQWPSVADNVGVCGAGIGSWLVCETALGRCRRRCCGSSHVSRPQLPTFITSAAWPAAGDECWWVSSVARHRRRSRHTVSVVCR